MLKYNYCLWKERSCTPNERTNYSIWF